MLYGAPRQSGLLAADLRSSAHQAADREGLRVAGDAGEAFTTAAGGRDPAPATVPRLLVAIVRQRIVRRPAAHAGVR
jgi:hypothetical protein